MMKNKGLGIAGIFAYILIALNVIYGLITGPLILKSVGNETYGVYSAIQSFANTLTIGNIGVTQTLIRYLSYYRANNSNKTEIIKLCNTIKVINYLLVVIVFVAAFAFYINISDIFRKQFTENQIILSKFLFCLFGLSILFSVLSDYYAGIISGYGYFLFINITKTISLLTRIVLTCFLVLKFRDVKIVAVVYLIITIGLYFANRAFANTIIHKDWSVGFTTKTILTEIATYTFLIFVQSIVDQINNNLDNIVIGSLIGAGAVAVYSFGIVMFHMFQNLSTAISQMLIPSMSNLVANKSSPSVIEEFLIKVGRIQFAIIGAVFFGFTVLGKRFICIWLGNGYDEAYIVTVILMIGGLFPLIKNGTVALLKAENLMGFRTVSLFLMATINAGLTYYLVDRYGFVFAAVGTSFGFVLMNTILMDAYLYKKLTINMLRVYRGILPKISISNIVTCISVYSVSKFMNEGVLQFLVLLILYVLIYFLFMMTIGFNNYEKLLLNKTVNSVLKKFWR